MVMCTSNFDEYQLCILIIKNSPGQKSTLLQKSLFQYYPSVLYIETQNIKVVTN